ncbi:MAG: O-antigen ligase family protein [Clostridia bacterium]|nr:O-antigen ligase family protein [Clostridia bacterium]
MGLKAIGEYVENNKVTRILRRALSSYFFPLVTACVSVACYYLGWDIVTIWYMCICGTAIMVCCKDVTPVICVLLFLNILVSLKHSPAYMGAASDYFIRPAILGQEIVAVAFWVGSVIFRLVTGIINRRFKLTPLFLGMVALCGAFAFSGLVSTRYTPLNLLYGLALSATILGIFTFFCGNIQIDEKTFIRIAYYLVALFGAVAFELLIAYCTYDGLIVDGKVVRALLYFGWGTYNQMGMLLTLTLPAWFYLAGKYKYGVAYLAGAIFNLLTCYLCFSRQAMIMGSVVFAACCVWLLIQDKGKKRIIDASVIGGVLVIAAIVMGAMHKDVAYFFSSFWDSLETGSGRIALWKDGLRNFLSKPVFGVGFYKPSAAYGEVGYFGDNLSYSIPRMCHNTIFQIVSACGLCGLITYVIHRTQTVISLINNVTHERLFVAMTMAALLLVCLLDNHIFYFLPTIVYAVLLALLSVTEKKSAAKNTETI